MPVPRAGYRVVWRRFGNRDESFQHLQNLLARFQIEHADVTVLNRDSKTFGKELVGMGALHGSILPQWVKCGMGPAFGTP